MLSLVFILFLSALPVWHWRACIIITIDCSKLKGLTRKRLKVRFNNNIVTDLRKQVGGVIGTPAFEQSFVKLKVDNWIGGLSLFAQT